MGLGWAGKFGFRVQVGFRVGMQKKQIGVE